jgi:hypothetical protein
VTGQGRVRDGSFRAILDVATARSRFEPLDRAGGGLVDWPAGQAPYLYGSYFHQFLRDRHGDETLEQLTDETAARLPYFGSPAFAKVFGRSLSDLWDEFERASTRDVDEFAPSVKRLTTHGFNVSGPRFGGDGRLYYSVLGPHGFPSLLAVDPAGGGPRRVTDRFLGNRIGVAGSLLVFDQVDVHAHVGLQSDLYAIGVDGTGRRRLTNGARAADPDVSPDGRTIVCTVQRVDRRELAVLPLRADGTHAAPEPLVSEPRISFDAPRWSPDGRWILAERGSREIVLVDPLAKRVLHPIAASPRGRALSAVWMPDGSLLFASDREGAGFRLYRSNLETLDTWRLEGTGPDARSPEISPDGRSIVFVGYTADGYDLFSLPLASATWTVSEPGVSSSGSSAPFLDAGASAPTASRPYSPWRTLAPRYWTPTLTSDGDELVVGAATGSADALGRHAYGVEAGWAVSRERPDWQAAYAYDRWWPTMFANVSDDTDSWRDGEVRTREANAGVLLPFRRVRWSQAVLAALHSSTDRFACAGCPARDIVRRAVRGGWRVNAARSFGYSISPEEGWTGTMTTELTRRALGADGDAVAFTTDLRGYLPIVPRHGVLAVRLAGAATWGDDLARRVFSASGDGPQPGGFRFGPDAIGLVRGMDDDELIGRHAAVANVDYRVPLMRLDRGAGAWPVFARVLHGAVFVDTANAWDTAFRRADVRVSVGAEASLDAVVGYRLPITLTTGLAWVSKGGGTAVFGRIGHAF